MNWIEVVLLILGVISLAASFIVPSRKKDDEGQQVDDELIRELIDKEIDDAKTRVTEVVDETLEYSVEKTERAAERLSNEKIMAISDYSETVLSDINKAHQEVMFLYDMLNDKHDNLKETVKQVDKTAKEAEEAASAAAAALAAQTQEEQSVNEKDEEAVRRERELELAAQDKEAREKEYARRQMARLILPIQRELNVQRELNMQQELNIQPKPQENQELRPLVVKSVEIVPADVVSSGEGTPQAKPVDIRPVEVYSFAEQAPHIERPVKNEKTQTAVDDSAENSNDKILRLHKLGFSNVDIAKELGLGVGEVKLVLNLFKAQ